MWDWTLGERAVKQGSNDALCRGSVNKWAKISNPDQTDRF
jgi:hypothetical protein